MSLLRGKQRDDAKSKAKPAKLNAAHQGASLGAMHRLELTAGSALMTRIGEDISAWGREKVKRSSCKRAVFVVSGPNTPGEGEIKMFRFLSSLPRAVPHGPLRVAVVGSDADLTLLALAARTHSPRLRLHLLPPPDIRDTAQRQICFCSSALLLDESGASGETNDESKTKGDQLSMDSSSSACAHRSPGSENRTRPKTNPSESCDHPAKRKRGKAKHTKSCTDLPKEKYRKLDTREQCRGQGEGDAPGKKELRNSKHTIKKHPDTRDSSSSSSSSSSCAADPPR